MSAGSDSGLSAFSSGSVIALVDDGCVLGFCSSVEADDAGAAADGSGVGAAAVGED